MRKPFILIALLAAAVFGTGYLIGQIHGTTPSSAAGPAPVQAPPAPGDRGQFDHRAPHAFGQVTAINGDTLTIKPGAAPPDAGQSVTTVVLSTTAQYFSAPGATASKAAIKVGTYIGASGTLSADGKMLNATRVMVLPGPPTAGGFHGFNSPHAAGQVTSIAGDTVTIKPQAGDADADKDSTATTIVLGRSTQYGAPHDGASARKDSIKTGSYILAFGTLSADGKTLTASRVMILPGAPGSGMPWHPGSHTGPWGGAPWGGTPPGGATSGGSPWSGPAPGGNV